MTPPLQRIPTITGRRQAAGDSHPPPPGGTPRPPRRGDGGPSPATRFSPNWARAAWASSARRSGMIQGDRVVALKFFLRGYFASETDIRRFREDMDAVALLDHPNIVPLYEVGEYERATLLHHEAVTRAVRWRPSEPCLCEPPPACWCEPRGRCIMPMHTVFCIVDSSRPISFSTRRGCLNVSDFGLAKHFANDTNLTPTSDIPGTHGLPGTRTGKLTGRT